MTRARSPVISELLVPLERGRGRPLQQQLVAALRTLVEEGHLRPGTRLPGTRELARALRVARNTVVQAYERLAMEGFVEQRPGSGTYVAPSVVPQPLPSAYRRSTAVPRRPFRRVRAHRLVDPHADVRADFWLGRVPPEAFPAKSWLRACSDACRHAAEVVGGYTDPLGLPELRRLLADRLRWTRGVEADPEQVVIVNGSQEALDLVAWLLVREGTPVVVEDPCYEGATAAFTAHGAELVPVPVDRAGIRTDLLPRRDAALVYVTPSHQYPLGFVTTRERRIALLEWARERGCYVVEDDYDSDFRYDGPPLTALKGLDREDAVFYVGTFSKALGPGLRLGYVVVPRTLVEAVRELVSVRSYGRSRLEQAALLRFLGSGAFDRHLRRLHRLYVKRRDRLLAGLEQIFHPLRVSGTAGGLHFALRLPEDAPPARVWAEEALVEGVVLIDFSRAAVHDAGTTDHGARTLLFGYAAAEEHAIDAAVDALARLARRSSGGTLPAGPHPEGSRGPRLPPRRKDAPLAAPRTA